MNHNLYDFILCFFSLLCVINGGSRLILPSHFNIWMCTYIWSVYVCVRVRNAFVWEFVDWITEKWFAWTESETGYDFLFHFSIGVSAKCTHLCKWKEKREHRRGKTVSRKKGMLFEIESDFADMIYALRNLFFFLNSWREGEIFSNMRIGKS